MEDLWTCVMEETGVTSWLMNDGSSMESTEDLLEDSPEARFERLCRQLEGPRPMTHRDMAEIQYLGLMLNVCSGALPLSTPLEGSGGFSGTVGDAIAQIENAINSGTNITHWKDVADAINNRQGVRAEECPGEENDLFRNISACNQFVNSGSFNAGMEDPTVRLLAFPNPVRSNSTTIQYNVPSRLSDSRVSIEVFDVSGRLVRNLLQETKPSGRHTTTWDLRNDRGVSVSAGIYFYRLKVDSEQKIQRLLVIRQ
jgi:hypothetical protein